MIKRISILILLTLQLLTTAAQKTFTHNGVRHTTCDTVYLVNNKSTNARQHTYRTVSEALRAAEGRTAAADAMVSIYIMPAVYWLDDPDDDAIRKPRKGSGTPFAMELTMSHVRMVGMADDAEDVVLAVNRGQTQGADGNYTMFYIEGNDIHAENITFGNYCNVDLVYPRDAKQNRMRRKEAIVQAQIGICRGTDYTFRNCRFISRLNLCPFVGGSNTTYTDCYFECTDDALNGSGVYRHCRFTLFSSKPFYTTDKTRGAVFIDCDLHTKTRGTQYLTKVSGPVQMTNCRWSSDDPNVKIEWNKKPDPKHRCEMNGCTLNGQPLVVEQPTRPLPISLPPMPLAIQREKRPGQWTIDCHKPGDTAYYDWQPDTTRSAWGYAEGVDGAEGAWGVVQIQRGARLMYTPEEEAKATGEQTCEVRLDPCKTGGQGFGSATGQYLDICIRFNTRTLTGYGLRLERTPDYDNAVAVKMVEYDNGQITAISEAKKCTLFKPGCIITLHAVGNTISAKIDNTHGGSEPMLLQAEMPHPAPYGGFHLQHTGSTGASATVIRSIMLR